MNAVYYISKGYRKVTVWSSMNHNGERTCIHTCTPSKSIDRIEKYHAIRSYLLSNFDIFIDEYKPTKAEK